MSPIIFRLVCARTHIHTQIPIIHTHAHTRAHIHICVCTHTHAHKYIHTQTQTGSHNMYYPSHASSKNTLGTFHSSSHRSAPLFVTRARVLFTQVSPGCGDAEVTHCHPCSHSCEHTSLSTCRHHGAAVVTQHIHTGGSDPASRSAPTSPAASGGRWPRPPTPRAHSAMTPGPGAPPHSPQRESNLHKSRGSETLRCWKQGRK